MNFLTKNNRPQIITLRFTKLYISNIKRQQKQTHKNIQSRVYLMLCFASNIFNAGTTVHPNITF